MNDREWLEQALKNLEDFWEQVDEEWGMCRSIDEGIEDAKHALGIGSRLDFIIRLRRHLGVPG